MFSMWRIESDLEEAGAPYDRRAAAYDHLVRSRTYNRIAWSASPRDYTAFAAAAFASDPGPLLEVAAGSAAATGELHARAGRQTVLVDLSRAMLDRAGRRIADASETGEVPERVRLLQADLLGLPFPEHGFTTVLGLGLTHLFDDVPALVTALRPQLAPGGRMFLAGLVAETRRGRRYLEILHRAGEVSRPMTAEELRVALGRPEEFHTAGCMAYAILAT
ncbi:MAG: hypothetical protein QOJ69_1503 [Actinomycetota bacterium]|nr:hypothetical protein [Actinomycetota bacterium]